MFMSKTRSRNTTGTSPAKPFQYHERENSFSTNVLVGNWFEERFASEIDPKAVAPAIYGKSQCSREITFYKKDFQQPIKKDHHEEHNEFIKWKQNGFSNRLHSEQTNIKLWDGEQFAHNYTTMMDIMFRLMPQEDPKNTETILGNKKANDDYMQSYGNMTKTGLLRWKESQQKKENERPIDVSHYKNNFQPIKIMVRKTCIPE